MAKFDTSRNVFDDLDSLSDRIEKLEASTKVSASSQLARDVQEVEARKAFVARMARASKTYLWNFIIDRYGGDFALQKGIVFVCFGLFALFGLLLQIFETMLFGFYSTLSLVMAISLFLVAIRAAKMADLKKEMPAPIMIEKCLGLFRPDSSGFPFASRRSWSLNKTCLLLTIVGWLGNLIVYYVESSVAHPEYRGACIAFGALTVFFLLLFVLLSRGFLSNYDTVKYVWPEGNVFYNSLVLANIYQIEGGKVVEVIPSAHRRQQ
ncbi:MAG: hypothetical protein K6F32_01095 [Bacilli bacterium]|nr:hypothetical protein [Bacilli bacterium]